MLEEKQTPQRTPEEIKRDAEILKIFDIVTRQFKPAADRKQATDVMCTRDFMNVMAEHYPGMDYFTKEEMYQLLVDNDYKYLIIDDSIVWMVRKI